MTLEYKLDDASAVQINTMEWKVGNNTQPIYGIEYRKDGTHIKTINLEYTQSNDLRSAIGSYAENRQDFAKPPQLEYANIELKLKLDMRTNSNNGDNKMSLQANYTDGTNTFFALYNTATTFRYNVTGEVLDRTLTIPNGKIVDKLIYVHQTYGNTGSFNTARLYGSIIMKGTQ